MHSYTRKLSMIAACVLAFAFSAAAQSVCPDGMVCISQAAANQAAENAREKAALEAKVSVLEAGLIEKDKSIEEVKQTARANEADLKDALSKTEVKLGTATGELIGARAQIVTQTAMIEFMLRNGRKKCSLTIICLP